MVIRKTRDMDESGALACTRRDLAAWLPEWDQLEVPRRAELLAHVRACPRCAAELDLIQRASAWLEGEAPLGACPTSEELYAMGRGPGAPLLAPERREALQAHLSACQECAAFAATLASRPPSPLELAPLAEPLPTQRPAVTPLRPLGTVVRRLIPWAAAAAAILVLFMLNRGGDTGAAALPEVRYPSFPTLRGERPGPLLFPREQLLAGAGGLYRPMVFEVLAPEGTTLVRVRLEQHAGGAFDKGTTVADLSASTGWLEGGEQTRKLAPGRYTWEAWAVVHGLDQPLGRRDFEIVLDPSTVERLGSLEQQPEPQRSESILALLHVRGYQSDARSFARSLPASPARSAYLEAQAAR